MASLICEEHLKVTTFGDELRHRREESALSRKPYFQTDISERELRTFLEELMKLSQCIVCKEKLKQPVVTCQQGHLSCYQCQKLKCDICSSDIVEDVQLSTVTTWLELVPRECKFSNRGCKAIILPISSHESHCPYSYSCRKCCYVGNLVKHVKTKHNITVVPSNVVTAYWNDLHTSPEMYCSINGSLFFLIISVKEGYVTTKVFCVRCKRTDTDFVYTLEYENGEIKYVYTASVFDYKSWYRYTDNNENFMKFPTSKLLYLCENGRLKFTLRISKLKQEAAIQGS